MSRVARQSYSLNGGSYSPTLDVGIIECNTSEKNCTIHLPNILSSNADDLGYKLFIQDVGNNASNNNIRIITSSREKVNGQKEFVINTNGGAVMLTPFGDFYWVASNAGQGSGGGSQKRLVATLRETNPLGSDPTQIDIENSITGTIVWSRIATGTYIGELTGGFKVGEYALLNLKPQIFESAEPQYPLYEAYLNRKDDDTCLLQVYFAPSNRVRPVETDGALNDDFDWKFEYIQKSM